MQADVQRQSSTNDDFSGRNGHVPSKQYNDRSGYNGGKWFNEKRNNNRRSEDLRSKSDFNYREQSSGRNAGNSGNSKVGAIESMLVEFEFSWDKLNSNILLQFFFFAAC